MRLSLLALMIFAAAPVLAQDVAPEPVPPPLTVDTINGADLASIAAQYVPPVPAADGTAPPPPLPDPAIIRLQVLLDRAGASPGVIDGFDGDNVRKAVRAFETMHGLPADGVLDAAVVAALADPNPAFGIYAVTADDLAAIGPAIPKDYAEQAKLTALAYTSLDEELAEHFHMDIDLFRSLNPGEHAAGDKVAVAAWGPNREGKVARIEADKTLRQVRAYDANDQLLVAYPATIGSEENPSPSGTHMVEAVAPNPTYTYNPKINFQQGDNTEVLTLPPGPNGPVGSMWIDLSEPTFGIHGTPEPSLIDKTGSHGCVRLTNWDAEELASMVSPGVPVVFLP